MAGWPHLGRGVQMHACRRGGLGVGQNQACLVGDMHKAALGPLHLIEGGGNLEDKLLGSP